MCFVICDALCNYLIPFVQFKTCEKHPWRSVTFSKAATKSNSPPWVFFTFLKIVQMVPNRAKCLKNIKVVMGGERGCQNVKLYLLHVAFSF